MENSSKNVGEIWSEYFHVNEEIKTKVRAALSTDATQIEKQVSELAEWARTQPQLPPESQDESFLERLLMRCKFNMEQSKPRLQAFFETLGKHPDIFSNLGSIKPSREPEWIVAFPNRTPTLERVIIIRMAPSLTHLDLDIDKCVIYFLTVAHLLIHRDYVIGARFIVDFDGMTTRHMSKITPWLAFKMMSFYKNMFKVSIKGIELLNCPHVVSFILNLARLVLTPKLFSRITVHDSMESLHKNVDRMTLPKEYGGELKNFDDLVSDWDIIMEEELLLFRQTAEVAKLMKSFENESSLWQKLRNSIET